MMRNVVWGIVVVGLAVSAKSAQAAPAWCGAEGVQKPFGNAYVKDALTKKDPRDALPDLVVVSCWPDDEAKSRMKEIDAARAKWSKALDLTEADWADVAQWSMEGAANRNSTDISVDYNKKYAWTTMGPLDQFAAIVRGLPNNGSGNSYSDYTYLTDAFGPRLSETGRMGYIIKACLNDNTDSTVVEWAICAPDLALFDKKKMGDEIRKDNSRKPFDKMIVRIQGFFLDEKIKEMQPKWKAAKEKDPAFAKVFEIAEKTRKDWNNIWKTEAAALDLMLAMDDVRQTSSRKLKEGCFEKTWPAVKAAISKVEAKRFEGFSTDIADSWLAPAVGVVSNSPSGWLALAAYHTCTRDFNSSSDNKDSLSSTIGSVLSFLPGYRGPRTAAQTAIMNAGLQLDDASAKIEFPSIDYRGKFSGMAARGYFATVAKVTVKGDQATVTFKPKLEKQEQCASSKSTNRISMISSSGTIYYESVCLKWKNVVVDRSPDPQTVDKRYVEGLKPGMNVIIGSPMVMAAFNKGKKVPSIVAGAAVK